MEWMGRGRARVKMGTGTYGSTVGDRVEVTVGITTCSGKGKGVVGMIGVVRMVWSC